MRKETNHITIKSTKLKGSEIGNEEQKAVRHKLPVKHCYDTKKCII